MGEKQLRIAIADDEPHVRRYLKVLIGDMKATVVGEASNGSEAVKVYRDQLPDVMLLDLNMPVESGESALKRIREEHPDAVVILLSSVSDREKVEDCLDLGASNYILKDTSPDEIAEIIRETFAATQEAGRAGEVQPEATAG